MTINNTTKLDISDEELLEVQNLAGATEEHCKWQNTYYHTDKTTKLRPEMILHYISHSPFSRLQIKKDNKGIHKDLDKEHLNYNNQTKHLRSEISKGNTVERCYTYTYTTPTVDSKSKNTRSHQKTWWTTIFQTGCTDLHWWPTGQFLQFIAEITKYKVFLTRQYTLEIQTKIRWEEFVGAIKHFIDIRNQQNIVTTLAQLQFCLHRKKTRTDYLPRPTAEVTTPNPSRPTRKDKQRKQDIRLSSPHTTQMDKKGLTTALHYWNSYLWFWLWYCWWP